MSNRFLVCVVFLVGCMAGGITSQLVVPKANAQQAAVLTKWEVFCISEHDEKAITEEGNKLGAEGWEIVGGDGLGAATNWCFKRAKM
jgi:hypothetical protein